MVLEDYFTQLTNLLPYPYNIVLSIIALSFLYLIKFYYSNNKVNIDKWIKFHFKFILSCLILFAVLLVVSYFLFSVSNPDIKITSPLNGTQVDIVTDIEGTGKNIPNDKFLWIIVSPHKTNDYHPAVEVTRQSGDYYFEVSVTIGTTRTVGDKYDILTVLADNKSHEEFKTYLDTADKNQIWPGMKHLPDGVKVYDRVTVIRK